MSNEMTTREWIDDLSMKGLVCAGTGLLLARYEPTPLVGSWQRAATLTAVAGVAQSLFPKLGHDRADQLVPPLAVALAIGLYETNGLRGMAVSGAAGVTLVLWEQTGLEGGTEYFHPFPPAILPVLGWLAGALQPKVFSPAHGAVLVGALGAIVLTANHVGKLLKKEGETDKKRAILAHCIGRVMIAFFPMLSGWLGYPTTTPQFVTAIMLHAGADLFGDLLTLWTAPPAKKDAPEDGKG